MIIVCVVLWLASGVWGSYIGNSYMRRHYGARTEWWELPLMGFLALCGLANLLVTVVMFWRR